jgi:hypothetical protein
MNANPNDPEQKSPYQQGKAKERTVEDHVDTFHSTGSLKETPSSAIHDVFQVQG